MIYAWRYPKSIHRSVMIGVNPPGHFLWSPKTTDALIGRYSRLCARDAGCSSGPTTSPPRCARRPRTCRDRFWFLPIATGNAKIASFYGLMESTSGVGAALGADDDRLVALGRRRRRERALVPVADGADGVPRVVRLGRGGRRRPGRHPGRRQRYFAQARTAATRSSATPAPSSSTAAAASRTRSRPAPDENEYTHVRDSNVDDPARRRAHSTSRRRRRSRPASCCRTSATADQVVLAGARTHRHPSGATSRRRARRLLNTYPRHRQGRHVALHAGEGRLHARRDAHRPRQGVRRDAVSGCRSSSCSRCC